MNKEKRRELIEKNILDGLGKERRTRNFLFVTAVIFSAVRLIDELFFYYLYRFNGQFGTITDRVITIAFWAFSIAVILTAVSLYRKGVEKAFRPAVIVLCTTAAMFLFNVYLWIPGIWFLQNKEDMISVSEKLISREMSVEEFEESEFSHFSERRLLVSGIGGGKVFFVPFYVDDTNFLGYIYAPEEKDLKEFRVAEIKYRVKGGRNGWYSVSGEDSIFKKTRNNFFSRFYYRQ